MDSAEKDRTDVTAENCSSNAIRNGFEKYSRFHSKNEFSVWSNSPKTKLTNGIRELVYQINPYNITCVYKKLFETCALNNLRILEFDADEEDSGLRSPSPAKMRKSGNQSEPTTPRSNEPQQVNKSNSCVYGTATELQSGTKRNSSDVLSGWETCKRPQSATCPGHTEHQKPSIAEDPRDLNKRPGKHSCCSAVSPRPFPNAFKTLRQNSARPSNTPSPDVSNSRRATRSRADESSSATNIPASSHKSPIKVSKHFKHFRRNTSYMDQYREEYTYRKLRDLVRPTSVDSLVCRCGSPNCTSSRSSPCIPTWYPVQSQLTRTMSLPRDMSGMTSGKPSIPPMRTPTVKKRPLQMAHYVKHLTQCSKSEQDAKKFEKPNAAKDTAKYEFFSTSLTVNNYNPTVKQSHSVARLASTPQGLCRQQTTPSRSMEKAHAQSPDVTASERFYHNKNERGT